MVRKQVLLSADQNQRLKALASASGKSEAALIREGLVALIANLPAEEENWKKAWFDAAGMWVDYPEIDEKIAQGRTSWSTRRKSIIGGAKD